MATATKTDKEITVEEKLKALYELQKVDSEIDQIKILRGDLPLEVQDYFDINAFESTPLHYPVLQYPKKITSLSLDKIARFQGKLMGIKGQYLIFEDGTVFNIRSNEGYKVRISI